MARAYYSWVRETPQNVDVEFVETWVGQSYVAEGYCGTDSNENTYKKNVPANSSTVSNRTKINYAGCKRTSEYTNASTYISALGRCENNNFVIELYTETGKTTGSESRDIALPHIEFANSNTFLKLIFPALTTTETYITRTGLSCAALTQGAERCYTTKELASTTAGKTQGPFYSERSVTYETRSSTYCYASVKNTIVQSGLEQLYSITAGLGVLAATEGIWSPIASPAIIFAPPYQINPAGDLTTFKEHIGFDLADDATYGFEYVQRAPNGELGFDEESKTFRTNKQSVFYSERAGTVTAFETISLTTKTPLYTEFDEIQHFFGFTTFTQKWIGKTTNTVPIGKVQAKKAILRKQPEESDGFEMFDEVWGDRDDYKVKNQVLYLGPPVGIAGFGFPPIETNKAYCSIKISSEGGAFAESQTITSPFVPISSCEWNGNNGAQTLKCDLSFYPTGKCFDFGEQEGTTKWKKAETTKSSNTSTIIEATYSSLIGTNISFRYATYSLSLLHSAENTFVRAAESETFLATKFGLKTIEDRAITFDGGASVRPVNLANWTTQIFYCDNTGVKTIAFVEPASYTIQYYSPTKSFKRFTLNEGSYSSLLIGDSDINLVAVTMQPIYDVCFGREQDEVRAQQLRYVKDTKTEQSVATSCPEIISPEYTCSSF